MFPPRGLHRVPAVRVPPPSSVTETLILVKRLRARACQRNALLAPGGPDSLQQSHDPFLPGARLPEPG